MMVKREDQRPIGAFAKAISVEIKGLMASHGVTQRQFADAIGRNQGYISERVNGIKAFNVDEMDTFAELIGETGNDLITIVARRLEEQRRPKLTVVSGGLQDGPAPFNVDEEERQVAYDQTQPPVGDPE